MKKHVREALANAEVLAKTIPAPAVAVQEHPAEPEAVIITPEPAPQPKALAAVAREALEAAERRARMAELDREEREEQQQRINASRLAKSPLNPNSPYNSDGTRKVEKANPPIHLPPPTIEALEAAMRPPLNPQHTDPIADSLTDPVYRKAFNYGESEAPKKSIVLKPQPAQERPPLGERFADPYARKLVSVVQLPPDPEIPAGASTEVCKCGDTVRKNVAFHVHENKYCIRDAERAALIGVHE